MVTLPWSKVMYLVVGHNNTWLGGGGGGGGGGGECF